MNLSIDTIDPSPLNPRKRFDEAALQELADSIREQGVLQPLTVRPAGDERYELVIGERRWRASKLAGLEEVPVVVRELHDEEVLEIMLVENDQRSGVTPLEEADAILMLSTRFGRDAEYIADRIGRSADFAHRRMKLGALIPELRELLKTERIGIGSAELLAACPEDMQREIAGGTLSADAKTWNGEPCSWNRHQVRAAIDRAARRIDLAPWSLTEDLTVRPCDGCPSRSSRQSSLLAEFAEGDDRCLEPECWHTKLAVWLERRRQEGAEVLEGEEAEGAAAYGSKTHRRIDDTAKWQEGKRVTVGELAPEAPRTFAVSGGRVYELVKIDDLVDEVEDDELAAKLSGDADKEQRKKEREEKRRAKAEREAKIARMVDAAASDFDAWLPTLLAGALTELHLDTRKSICERRGLEVPSIENQWGTKRRDYEGALLEHAEALSSDEQRGLLAEVCLRGSIGSTWGTSEAISKKVDEMLRDDRSIAARIFAGEVPGVDELEALTVKELRALLVDDLDVKHGDTTKKTKAELVELVVRYAETETSCVTARGAA